MIKVIIVGLGGFVGAILRYLISSYANKIIKSDFPYGTLAVNMIGCLLIGLFLQWDHNRDIFSRELRLFLFIGLFGAFTTYSTFSNETWELMQNQKMLLPAANIIVHIAVGLFAVWLGRSIGQAAWS